MPRMSAPLPGPCEPVWEADGEAQALSQPHIEVEENLSLNRRPIVGMTRWMAHRKVVGFVLSERLIGNGSQRVCGEGMYRIWQ